MRGRARADGFRALSLSVERDKAALALYQRVGFRPVAAVGNSLTMILSLREET